MESHDYEDLDRITGDRMAGMATICLNDAELQATSTDTLSHVLNAFDDDNGNLAAAASAEVSDIPHTQCPQPSDTLYHVNESNTPEDSAFQGIPFHLKDTIEVRTNVSGNAPGLWAGVPRPCLARNRTNFRGRSLSENALNTRLTEFGGTSTLNNCTLGIEYGPTDPRSPNRVVDRDINDVFVNIIPPLDIQPPSYEYICKINKLDAENSGTVLGVSGIDTSSVASNGNSATRPPTYREATADGRYLEDAPPTYHSLFTESMLRAMQPFTNSEGATAESSNAQTIPKARKVIAAVLSFLLLAVVIGFILVMPLCMITVGVANIHSCPLQPRIPIYLIVLGIFQMLECCGRLGYYLYRASVSMDIRRERFKNKDPLVYFMVVWFVVGSMWVYQTPSPCFTCKEANLIQPFNISTTNATIVHNGVLEAIENKTLITTLKPMQTTAVLHPTDQGVSEHYCDATVYLLAFWLVTVYYGVVGLLCLIVILDAAMRIIGKCCCRRR